MVTLKPLRLPVVFLPLALLCPAVALAGWSHDPSVNTPLAIAPNDQTHPALIADGAGGVFAVWEDYRRGGTNSDIYVQRFSYLGAAQWAANGVGLTTTAGGFKTNPKICSDGAGGIILCWQGTSNGQDIFAQRVNSSGVPQWAANGVVVCGAAGDQSLPAIATDGAGGAIIVWQDQRGSNRDIYTQRVNSAGTAQWTADGVAVSTAANDQWSPSIVADGSGGAFFAWPDDRNLPTGRGLFASHINNAGTLLPGTGIPITSTTLNTNNAVPLISDGSGSAIVAWPDTRGLSGDLYAQRMNALGAQLWGTLAVCAAAGAQSNPAMAADGSGGAIIAWDDLRSGTDHIYAQRITSAGTVASGWTTDGVQLCNAAQNENLPRVVSDGAGGGVVAWLDHRSGAYDVYATRVLSAGVIATGWPTDGSAVGTAANDQNNAAIETDGMQGAIVAFRDLRNASDADLYIDHVDLRGTLGGPEPYIVGARDIPNDQGGHVRVAWSASYLDQAPGYRISAYGLWRQVPATLAKSRIRGAVSFLAPAERPKVAGSLRVTRAGVRTIYWEYVGATPARAFDGYSAVAATFTDSVAGSNPNTLFMVEAQDTVLKNTFYDSPVDSGYSVDNLAPAVPSQFTGQYVLGTATLHWGASSAPDFAVYRVYRGTDSTFVPGPSNLLVQKPDTGYVDVAGAPYYYRLTAVDVHGNESPSALLRPDGTASAGVPTPGALALDRPRPNPGRGPFTLRFTLPFAAAVDLEVYDLSGHVVCALARGTMAAGEHVARWDGRDKRGQAAPSGIYFVRLHASGSTLSRQMLRLE